MPGLSYLSPDDDSFPFKMHRELKIYRCQPGLEVDFESVPDDIADTCLFDQPYGKYLHEPLYNGYRKNIPSHF